MEHSREKRSPLAHQECAECAEQIEPGNDKDWLLNSYHKRLNSELVHLLFHIIFGNTLWETPFRTQTGQWSLSIRSGHWTVFNLLL